MRRYIYPITLALLLFLLFKPNQHQQNSKMAETKTIHGVKIVRNPPQSTLTELGVTSWPKWSCDPSKFPWQFSTGTETMYLLEGKVKVHVDGFDDDFEIKAGDLVEFPRDMKVVWDVIESVNKHYQLH